MVLSIKLKREGHKRLYKYSIIVIEKKKSIKSVYQEKIGNYVFFRKNTKIGIFISEKKLIFWRNKGVSLGHKLEKLVYIEKNV